MTSDLIRSLIKTLKTINPATMWYANDGTAPTASVESGFSGSITGSCSDNIVTASFISGYPNNTLISGSAVGTYTTGSVYTYTSSIVTGSVINDIVSAPYNYQDFWTSGSYGSRVMGCGPVFSISSGSNYSIISASVVMGTSSLTVYSSSMLKLCLYKCDTTTTFYEDTYPIPSTNAKPLYEVLGGTLEETIPAGAFGVGGYGVDLAKITFIPTASWSLPSTGYYVMIVEPDYTLMTNAFVCGYYGPSAGLKTPITTPSDFSGDVSVRPYAIWKEYYRNVTWRVDVSGTNYYPLYLAMSGSGIPSVVLSTTPGESSSFAGHLTTGPASGSIISASLSGSTVTAGTVYGNYTLTPGSLTITESVYCSYGYGYDRPMMETGYDEQFNELSVIDYKSGSNIIMLHPHSKVTISGSGINNKAFIVSAINTNAPDYVWLQLRDDKETLI